VCSVSIAQLSGKHLASYDIVRLYVDLDEVTRASYGRARETFLSAYRQFHRTTRSASWDAFVRVASCSSYGRAALRAFHESRTIVSTAREKGDLVAKLLAEHSEEPVLVFTADNAAAYALSRRLLVPALTCHIGRARERKLAERHLARRLKPSRTRGRDGLATWEQTCGPAPHAFANRHGCRRSPAGRRVCLVQKPEQQTLGRPGGPLPARPDCGYRRSPHSFLT
jgi:hypothetical protein